MSETNFYFPSSVPSKHLEPKNPYLAQLTDIQLADCANDLLEFKKTSLLKSQSIIRELLRWIGEVTNLPNFYTLSIIEGWITDEIYRRYVNKVLNENTHYRVRMDTIPSDTVKVGQTVWYCDGGIPDCGVIEYINCNEARNNRWCMGINFGNEFNEFEIGFCLNKTVFTSLEACYQKYPSAKPQNTNLHYHIENLCYMEEK